MISELLSCNKERLSQSPSERQSQRNGRGVQSSYAAVNREWQAFFEGHNFGKFILGNEDPGTFGKIVSRSQRKRLVRWIWLRVELPEYGCDVCAERETDEEWKVNEVRFTQAVQDLFSVLAKFSAGHPGITLELSAHSPSDAEHYCQELKNTINDTMWALSERHDPIPDDEAHGWRGNRRRPLDFRAYVRVSGNPKGLGLDLKTTGELPRHMLPKVKAVDQIVVGLQFLRHLSIGLSLSPIIYRLPRLRTLHYEGWQGVNVGGGGKTGQEFRQGQNQILFDHIMAPRKVLREIREIRLFEASSPFYDGHIVPAPPDSAAGRSLSNHSTRLESLHVDSMADARDFFHDFFPGRIMEQTIAESRQWLRLRYLSLSTTNLSGILLQAAAAAAERMPELRTMKLSVKDPSDLFIYFVQDRQHVIVLPSRMACPKTVKSWGQVAAIRGSPTM